MRGSSYPATFNYLAAIDEGRKVLGGGGLEGMPGRGKGKGGGGGEMRFKEAISSSQDPSLV